MWQLSCAKDAGADKVRHSYCSFSVDDNLPSAPAHLGVFADAKKSLAGCL
jgi:hypothetical protein